MPLRGSRSRMQVTGVSMVTTGPRTAHLGAQESSQHLGRAPYQTLFEHTSPLTPLPECFHPLIQIEACGGNRALCVNLATAILNAVVDVLPQASRPDEC